MTNLIVKPSLRELRELIGAVEHTERARSSFSLFSEGFPVGALIELSGHGKTELVSLFLKEHADFKVAWIEEEMDVNPYALFQRGVRTENIVFIEARKNLSWCVSQSLQSGCFQAVVAGKSYLNAKGLKSKGFDEKELRRYQLLAERSQAHCFLLSSEPCQSWVPNLQLSVSKKKVGFKVEIIRKRGLG